MSSAKDKGLFVVLMCRSERRCDENMEKVEGLLSKVSAARQPCGQGRRRGQGHWVNGTRHGGIQRALILEFAVDQVTDQGKIDVCPADSAQLSEILVKKVGPGVRFTLD